MWFGLGDAAKVAFLSLAAFFPVVLNTFEGVRSVPADLLEVARVLRFSRGQTWRKLILPEEDRRRLVLSAAEARPLELQGMTPVGNYAYALAFSDGHDTGIYTLELLRELGEAIG